MQVLRLLKKMCLEQYIPFFKQEQIDGRILSKCTDALLKEELKITTWLNRMRLLRVIEGADEIINNIGSTAGQSGGKLIGDVIMS